MYSDFPPQFISLFVVHFTAFLSFMEFSVFSTAGLSLICFGMMSIEAFVVEQEATLFVIEEVCGV